VIGFYISHVCQTFKGNSAIFPQVPALPASVSSLGKSIFDAPAQRINSICGQTVDKRFAAGSPVPICRPLQQNAQIRGKKLRKIPGSLQMSLGCTAGNLPRKRPGAAIAAYVDSVCRGW
jgi:hypothetical protein